MLCCCLPYFIITIILVVFGCCCYFCFYIALLNHPTWVWPYFEPILFVRTTCVMVESWIAEPYWRMVINLSDLYTHCKDPHQGLDDNKAYRHCLTLQMGRSAMSRQGDHRTLIGPCRNTLAVWNPQVSWCVGIIYVYIYIYIQCIPTNQT